MRKVSIPALVLAVVLVGIGIFAVASNIDAPASRPDFASSPRPDIQRTISPADSRQIPVSKALPGSVHAFQTFNNCGPASLSMALSIVGTNVHQSTLGQELRPFQHPNGDNDDKSVTLEELSAIATDYGFESYFRSAGNMEMVERFIAADIPVITRTLLTLDDDIGHYRVIKGYDQSTQTLLQDDSLQGKDLEFTYADFEKLWEVFNYEFMVLVPPQKAAVAREILGELYDEQTAWEIALQNSATGLNKSVALYHLGRYEESIAAFEAVENSLPFRTLWYQIEPILAYYKVGEYDRVLEITQNILENNNRAFSELHYLQGLVYEARGNIDASAEAFSLANYYNSGSAWKENIKGI